VSLKWKKKRTRNATGHKEKKKKNPPQREEFSNASAVKSRIKGERQQRGERPEECEEESPNMSEILGKVQEEVGNECGERRKIGPEQGSEGCRCSRN